MYCRYKIFVPQFNVVVTKSHIKQYNSLHKLRINCNLSVCYGVGSPTKNHAVRMSDSIYRLMNCYCSVIVIRMVHDILETLR